MCVRYVVPGAWVYNWKVKIKSKCDKCCVCILLADCEICDSTVDWKCHLIETQLRLIVCELNFAIVTWLSPSIGTLKPHSNGPLYSNTVIGSWYTGRLWLGYIWCSKEGPGRAVGPPSPLLAVPIDGQCTNFILFDVMWHCKYLCQLNG